MTQTHNDSNVTETQKPSYYEKEAAKVRNIAERLTRLRYFHEQEGRTTTVYTMGRLQAAIQHLEALESRSEEQECLLYDMNDAQGELDAAASALHRAARAMEQLGRVEGSEKIGLGRARAEKIGLTEGGFANVAEKRRAKYREDCDLQVGECVGLEIIKITSNGKNARVKTRSGMTLFVKTSHLVGTADREGFEPEDPDADFPVEDVDVAHAVNL